MGLFEHMHIKRRTEGSSNELSFDVLQKASGDGASPTKTGTASTHRKGKGGTINLSRVNAANEAAANAYEKAGKHRKGSPRTKSSGGQSFVLSGSPEVARRKKARRGYRILTRVTGGLVIILLLCVGVLVNERITMDRMSFKSRLTNLTTQLATIDKDLVLIDQQSLDPLMLGDYTQMEELRGQIPGIMSSIVGVEEQIQEIRETKPGGYDAQALDDLESAAIAREELLSNAARLFELSVQAGGYIEQADSTWKDIVEASQNATDAVTASGQATSENDLQKSNEIIRESLDDLSAALRQLEFLKTNLNGLDLSPFIEFVTAKSEALQFALDTNDALIDLDRTAAQNANDSYNVAEKEANDRAAAITLSPSDAVRNYYQQRVDEASAAYETARDIVIEADATLRKRLA